MRYFLADLLADSFPEILFLARAEGLLPTGARPVNMPISRGLKRFAAPEAFTTFEPWFGLDHGLTLWDSRLMHYQSVYVGLLIDSESIVKWFFG